MGADGGVVGIKLRDPSSQEGWNALIAAVPWELRTEDRSEHYPYREADEIPGWWYCTYGSYQDWDLGRLPGMVVEAREYAAANPGATFETWVEDIYTSSDPDYFTGAGNWAPGDMTEFLADRYLGCYSGRGTLRNTREPAEPEYLRDGFYRRSVAEWVETICRHVDIDAYPDHQETWT